MPTLNDIFKRRNTITNRGARLNGTCDDCLGYTKLLSYYDGRLMCVACTEIYFQTKRLDYEENTQKEC